MAKDLFQNLPFDDETLAALIEGELGELEAEAVRERLLATDPELAGAIEQMEGDRIFLRALGDERPSAGLAESIVARLEREALVGLAQGEPTGAPMRVSTVRRAPSGARWSAGRLGAGLALAAVLALAVGVALQIGGPRRPSPIPGPIAKDSGPTPLQSPGADSTGPEGSKPLVAADAPKNPIEDNQSRTLTRAAKQAAVAWTPVSDMDRALGLLAEGRLVVRLRAAAPDDAMNDLGRLADQPDRPGKAFRIQHEVAATVALAMEQRFATPEAEPLVYADRNEHHSDPAPAPQRRSALEAVYMADARMDKAALLSLQAALSLGDGRVAQFEELSEPLDLPRVLTPDAVLWWSRPPSEWSNRAFVPVVVERVDR